MAAEVREDWIAIAASDRIAPSQVRSVTADEVDLVVWRGSDGVACVMEARCPHQWSHLEAEGVVDGDEIVCVSHFWRFDRDGRGSKLTETGRRDPKADITVFPCREKDGRIEIRVPGGHLPRD